MRPCTVAVKSFLDNWTPLTDAAVIDLYTITLLTGEVFRFSGGQRAVDAPAPETSSPLICFERGPRIDRDSTKTQIGVEVDILNLNLYVTEVDLIVSGGTLSWQDALRQGLFDGASCEVWRCVISLPNTIVGTITWFYGHVGDVEIGRTKCTLKIKSLLNLLKVQMPKRLFQSSCTFIFGDAQCGFNRDVDGPAGPGNGGPSYAIDITSDVAYAVNTRQTQVHATGLVPVPVTLFNQGTIIGLTGPNAGYKRTIISVDSEIVYVLHPWIFYVSIGDQFRLLPGCDHKLDTCTTVFNNVESDGSARSGGFPFIPPPETAI